MISISLVRGYHECTKGPTQPPDTARWIWYKKTDSRTVRGLVLWYRIAYFAKNYCNFFDNCIKGHNTFKLNCNHNTVLLKMTLKPIAILKGSCYSCKVLY